MGATATVNGVVIAATDYYETVEGNIYFPPASIMQQYFTETKTSTHCPWKGDASYYTVEVGDGVELCDAAWFYPEPYEKAANIKGYVAFSCKAAILSGARPDPKLAAYQSDRD